MQDKRKHFAASVFELSWCKGASFEFEIVEDLCGEIFTFAFHKIIEVADDAVLHLLRTLVGEGHRQDIPEIFRIT